MTSDPGSTTISYGIGTARTLSVIVLLLLFSMWNRTVQKFDEVPYSTEIRLVGSRMVPQASPDELPPASANAKAIARIGFAGDIMQHRGQKDDDFSACYQEIRPLLRSFDLAVGNLEFPVDPERPVGPPLRSGQFNGSPRHVAALADAGFDVLCTSNNHSFDQGLEGVLATLGVLRSHGITPVGTAAETSLCGPVLVDCQGLRIAMVAYTMRPNVYYQDGVAVPWPRDWPICELNFSDWSAEYRQQGQALFERHAAAADRLGADFLIALVHWGEEWHFGPTDDQRLAARDLVDAGFDLVVGGHSHVINPPEIYDDKLIAYSLGNFISDFSRLETRLGAVLEVTIVGGNGNRAKTVDFRYHPILTEREGHIVRPMHRGQQGDDSRAWQLAEEVFGSSLAGSAPCANDSEGPADSQAPVLGSCSQASAWEPRPAESLAHQLTRTKK